MSETSGRPPPARTRSNFAARTATDDAAQLHRRSSLFLESPSPNDEDASPFDTHGSEEVQASPERHQDHAEPSAARCGMAHRPWSHSYGNGFDLPLSDRSSGNTRGSQQEPPPRDYALATQMHAVQDSKGHSHDLSRRKPGAMPRPVGGTSKLGTFSGVFVPTSLNVLSILMFLRFGFILGQSGVLGMLGMLIACYAINLLTTLSISAIATNGTVRGGGAYYLISRSLGPEFGGSIGLVFYLGFVLNTGMNAVGLVDCFIQNFGSKEGTWSKWLPEGFWWQYLWSTGVLAICTAICLAGSGLFARCSNGLLVILLISTFSIPFSALIMRPFEDGELGVYYTGLSFQTLKGNMMPMFTAGAEGSQLPGKENFQDLFGILFPATGGIFAGASMSGDLKHPSKAIPKGTLYGLALTFVTYTIVILSMAATVGRSSFYRDLNVIQDVNISRTIILLGEFATSFFSALMGVIGSAKLLQALARDHLIPGLSLFGQGTKSADEPTYAIIATFLIAQLTMLTDINQIASLVTMTYLMTFLVTNLACFLLKISSAPNFRPSFHYFNWRTAAIGTIISGATMFFVDGIYASGCVAILMVIFLLIHYTTSPKAWGDVSQSLIYHQVRKYLLRLRQEHVKFWRPQILLFINDPRRQYKLIQFCNSLKKGGLFVLGHVIVTQDFGGAVPEARRQQSSWTKYIDFSRIKAFVNIAISPAVEWGARNIVLSAGLGGMRPNIVVMGFYNLTEFRNSQALIDVQAMQPSPPSTAGENKPPNSNKTRSKKKIEDDKLRGRLPTDAMRRERAIGATNYVTILEDLLLRLQINVAVAKGFQDIDLPGPRPTRMERVMSVLSLGGNESEEIPKKFIDLWPIQMSAEIAAAAERGRPHKSVLTTNFDTYTLILQLGCILNTVPSWKRTYKLRVAVFVEYESDVEEERGRVKTLLNNLRIQAEVMVFWLASGSLRTYEIIINGHLEDMSSEAVRVVNEALAEEVWWQDIQKLRDTRGTVSAVQELAAMEGLLDTAQNWPESSFQHGRREARANRFAGLRKMLIRSKSRASFRGVSQLGVNLGMRTHRLGNLVRSGDDSSSESDSSSAEELTVDDLDSDFAVSENDIEDYNAEESGDDRRTSPMRRSRSLGATSRMRFVPGILRRRQTAGAPTSFEAGVVQAQTVASASDSALVDIVNKPKASRKESTPASLESRRPLTAAQPRPLSLSEQSLPKFSSKPTPQTKIATEDDTGPSIMFSDQPSLDDAKHSRLSIYQRSGSGDSQNQAGGFPLQQAIPLSFNDLPCRAQHLILNELIQQHSNETAVIFTTLPSPVEGTCHSEADSIKYLNDLEVLCEGLPPALLVHSNSMTVTMNL